MNSKILLFVTIVATIIAYCCAFPAASTHEQNNGKYQFSNSLTFHNNAKQLNDDGKYHSNHVDDGKYHPKSYNEGRMYSYTDAAGRRSYVPMNWAYHHVHDNRELGKYVHIPYPYDGGYGPYSGLNLPYVHDARPYDHNLYTTTTTTTTKKPTTTTKRTTTTTTTTTTTPRNILFNYDDEGRHKILHQEEKRKQDRYDHAYLTENGIYGEEQAKLHHNGGTHAVGYYEYTGDDGKLYRVNYQSNHDGFVPTGDHIPTPPPIPEAIARALKYVEEKRKANGESPMFDHRGFRIEDMPKEMWAELRRIQHEMEIAEEEEQKAQQRYETTFRPLVKPTPVAPAAAAAAQDDWEDAAWTTEATTDQYLV